VNDAPLHATQRGRDVILAYGDRAARLAMSPTQPLASAIAFRAASRALGAGFSVSTYVKVAPILTLAESMGARSNPDYEELKPALQAIDYFIVGSGGKRDAARTRIQIGYR
jgi:hypothetical protein